MDRFLLFAAGWLLAAETMALPVPPSIRLVDVSAASGIDSVHDHGGCGERRFIEQVGGGVALFDVDGDGRLDVFLTSGTRLPSCRAASDAAPEGTCRLWRSVGDGRYEDVSDKVGVRHLGYATGCVAGDLDNDGDDDLIVTGHGGDWVLLNDGGVLCDGTRSAGLGKPGSSASCALLDYDLDGRLDLYMTRYVQIPQEEPRCQRNGVPLYCLPQDFRAGADRLYRNLGGGRFRDVTREAGVYQPRGRGLGVVATDFDGDGDADLFVANDAGDNYLFQNDGEGRFRERALLVGVALGGDGAMENGMGVDSADFDNDGDFDLFVTNFERQTNTLSENLGDDFFIDISAKSGLGAPSYPWLGWSALFGDLDLDGWQDLFVVNGHVYDNAAVVSPGSDFGQRHLLFCGAAGKRFESLSVEECPALAVAEPSRGAAIGDLDNDGDLDLVVSNIGRPPQILENRTVRARRHWVGFTLVGENCNRSAIGARLTLRTAAGTQTREVKAGSGYLSCSDRRLLFGIGEQTVVESCEVQWPGGAKESFPVAAVDAYHTLRQADAAAPAEPKKAGRPNNAER